MPMIPAIMTGTMSEKQMETIDAIPYPDGSRAKQNLLLTIRSGLRTPMAAMPTPDFAVPYDAPRQVKTMAAVQPMAPKKGCGTCQCLIASRRWKDRRVSRGIYRMMLLTA